MTGLRFKGRHARDRTSVTAVPDWPDVSGSERMRVLVEHPEPAARHELTRGLREHGYEVVGCGGPNPSGAASPVSCPILDGEACSAVDGADIIVSSLNVNGAREGLIVRRIAEDPSSPPLIVEATDWQVEEARLKADALVHHYPFGSIEQVVEAIEGLRGAVPRYS